MEQKERVIECAVPMISVDIGNGNRLVLVEGDKLTVSLESSARKRYRVFSDGKIIGYITNRSIHYIMNKPLQKGARKHGTVAER